MLYEGFRGNGIFDRSDAGPDGQRRFTCQTFTQFGCDGVGLRARRVRNDRGECFIAVPREKVGAIAAAGQAKRGDPAQQRFTGDAAVFDLVLLKAADRDDDDRKAAALLDRDLPSGGEPLFEGVAAFRAGQRIDFGISAC